MTLLNLTPHPIRIYEPDTPDRIDDLLDGLLAVIPATAPAARVATINLGPDAARAVAAHGPDGEVAVPVDMVEYGHLHDLPPQQEGVHLIVSLVVATAALSRRPDRPRTDLLVPYREVRNTDGAVVGCRALAHPV